MNPGFKPDLKLYLVELEPKCLEECIRDECATESWILQLKGSKRCPVNTKQVGDSNKSEGCVWQLLKNIYITFTNLKKFSTLFEKYPLKPSA